MGAILRAYRRLTHSRTAAVVAGAVLLVVIGTVVGVRSGRSSPQLKPPPNPADCRSSPMAHVHHPTRLEVLMDCVAISGRVRSLRFVPAYGSTKVTISVDKEYARFLPYANRGSIVAEVIATDRTRIQLPAPGQHASFYGAWVMTRATRRVQLLPTWRVVFAPNAVAVDKSIDRTWTRHDGQPVRLTLTGDRTVPVGAAVVLRVRASWAGAPPVPSGGKVVGGGVRRPASGPASQIRLFLEVTNSKGVGVRWKAVMTNTSGAATVRLLSLHVPGNYRVTAYVVGPAPGQPATHSLRVRRR